MKISDETKAELRRLHAEESVAGKAFNDVSDQADGAEWRSAFDRFDRAHMRLYAKMVANIIPLLEALAASEAEREGLRAQMGRPYPDECPCENEKPDPCPACGASVAKGSCMARKYRRSPCP